MTRYDELRKIADDIDNARYMEYGTCTTQETILLDSARDRLREIAADIEFEQSCTNG